MAGPEDPIRVLKGFPRKNGLRVVLRERRGNQVTEFDFYPEKQGPFRGGYFREVEALAQEVAPRAGQQVFEVRQQIEGILRRGQAVPLPPRSGR